MALFSSKNTCGRIKEVHPPSIAVKHALVSSKNTCGRIKEVHPASIAVKHALFSSKNTFNIEISSSSFDCSETRVIFVEEYVWIIKISFPASIAVKQALFSSLDAWR